MIVNIVHRNRVKYLVTLNTRSNRAHLKTDTPNGGITPVDVNITSIILKRKRDDYWVKGATNLQSWQDNADYVKPKVLFRDEKKKENNILTCIQLQNNRSDWKERQNIPEIPGCTFWWAFRKRIRWWKTSWLFLLSIRKKKNFTFSIIRLFWKRFLLSKTLKSIQPIWLPMMFWC